MQITILSLVRFMITGEPTRMNFRMQCLDSPFQDLGRIGNSRDISTEPNLSAIANEDTYSTYSTANPASRMTVRSQLALVNRTNVQFLR